MERRRGEPKERRLRQITPEVGRFLHAMVLAAKPGSMLELGTSGAYSTIWLATAARHVGSTLITVEVDPGKIRLATANLREAGLDDAVTIVEADALTFLRDRREPIDFVFLDAEKDDYVAYLELIVPLLSHGGVLIADNLLSHADQLHEFRERAVADPGLSAVVVPVGRGELLAVKLG